MIENAHLAPGALSDRRSIYSPDPGKCLRIDLPEGVTANILCENLHRDDFLMQRPAIDQTDRRILHLLQQEPGINATAIGDRIGLSQSACWRRIQRMRDEGIIREHPVLLDREKVGLNTMVFAQVKLTSHGRGNLAEFADAVTAFPEVLDCYVLLGNVDFLLRIVTEDIKAYEQFFFEKLSQLPGIQEVNSSIVMSDVKNTTVLPI
jgi:Lrp/AsnC family transcriptional regulator